MTAGLLKLAEEFVDRDPATAARRLEGMAEEDAAAALDALPAECKARLFPQFQIGYAASLLRDAEPEDFEAVIAGLDPQRAAAVFTHMPEDARERFAGHLPESVRRHVRELMTYPEDSVGRVMSPQYLSLHRDLTVGDAIRRIRQMRHQALSYAYVVEDGQKLVGVLNMRDLLTAEPGDQLSAIMRTEVFALPAFMEVEEAAAALGRRRYFAAPVVDNEGGILGVVKAESLLRGARQELGEDLLRMVGAGADEGAFSPIRYSLRKRLPWLHVNLLTAFMAAGVIALFEDTIARMTVLAIFLPVVAGQGGNSGAQSLAIVMRGLVMREIPRSRWRRLIAKEALLGSISGAVTGLITGLIAWVWFGNPMLGVVIALGMIVNMICAGIAGASIPLLLKSVGLDPAQCSAIILTTVTDVVGFFAFLGFAVLLLEELR